MPPSRHLLLLTGLLVCAASLGLPGRGASEPLLAFEAAEPVRAGWSEPAPVQISWSEPDAVQASWSEPEPLPVHASLSELAPDPVPAVPLGLGGDFVLVPLPAKQVDADRGSVPGSTQEASPSAPATVSIALAHTASYRLEDNKYVRRYIDQYRAAHRAAVEGWLGRAGQYLPMVVDIFKQKGLPEELVFTAMIESGFNPVAVSRAGAKGLWQFMAPTARRYGLRVDQWLDERLDPEKSTIAAARHFIDLYAVFGSWNLAKAAYNAGEGRVATAIRSMGTRDFWKLASGSSLKEETRNFVPAIHAAATIAREPERFGFVVTFQEPVQYDRVTVPGGTSLARLAQQSGLTLDDLERLNPELTLRQTPPGAPHSLKVPPGTATAVELALSRDVAAKPRRTIAVTRGGERRIHLVQPNDTLYDIARRYGVTVADIQRWNAMPDASLIRPGHRLRVARGAAAEVDASPR